MKTTFISREKDDVKFSIEFTAEEFENAQIEAYKSEKDKYAIDGFRKGKAPRSIIEKHYGEGVFFEAAIDQLFADNYMKALNELNLEVIDSPRIEFGKIAKGEPITITFTVACFPIVDVKDYVGVETEKIEEEVTEEKINDEIKALQKRNARVANTDNPAKDGDTVLFDFAGYCEGVQFEGGTAEKQTLTLGSGMFIPGFEEQLIGLKAGDDKDVEVVFPEDYHADDLAGKPATFKCHIHEVREEILPELDDEFAKDVSEFDTYEELRNDTKTKLEAFTKMNNEAKMKDALIEKVVESNPVDAPDSMVEEELGRMFAEIDQQLSYQGLGLDQYLTLLQKDKEELKGEMRPDAEKSVKTRIVLNGVAVKENIEVTEEDLNTEFEFMAKQYNLTADKVKELIGEDNMVLVKKDLLTKKAIEFIFNNAKIK